MSEKLGDVASIAEQEFETYRKLYEFENNPLWAWIVYRRARTWGVPIPEWVLIYLDDVSQKLWGKHSASVREALGFAYKGRGTRYNQYLRAFRDIKLAIAVDQQIRKNLNEIGEEQLVAAYGLVAEEYKETRPIVRRAYEKFSGFLDHNTQ